MEGEERKTEGTAEAEKNTPTTGGGNSQETKPKQNPRKRRNNKSAADRKAQKAKANTEKAAAVARKTGQATADNEVAELPQEPAQAATPDSAGENVNKQETPEQNAKKTENKNLQSPTEKGERPAAEQESKPEEGKVEASAEAEEKKATPAKKTRTRKTTTGKTTTAKSTSGKTTTGKTTTAKSASGKTTAGKNRTKKTGTKTQEKPETEDNRTSGAVAPAITAETKGETAQPAKKAEAQSEKTDKSDRPTDEISARDKTSAPEDEKTEKTESETGKQPDEKPIFAEDESELSEEERRHKAEMTRTVQLSIEQILAHSMTEDNSAEEQTTDDTSEMTDEEGEERAPIAQRISEAATDGLYSLLKWLGLVLAFAAVIAVLGVYWLYRGTTPDMVPQFTLSVDGQTVETAAYEWKVPVVGNLFKRTYAETLHAEPVALPKAIENSSPFLDLEAGGEFDEALTIKDSAGEEVFNGTLADFEKFSFTDNDNYTALLVISTPSGSFSRDAVVTGRQVYQFTFDVDIRPTVRVNTQSVTQGGVVSVSVTNIPEGEIPSLVSGLSNAGFVKASKGWIAYIPIPCEADTSKSYDIRVKTDSYDQTVTLTVRPRTSAYKDYSSKGALTGNYIGVDNTPEKVNQILDICDPQVYWMASGFVQPFIHSITVTLPYGTTEYVGRTVAQRTSGAGNGRTSTCVVVSGHQGEVLISPADGRIVLAEDLGGDAGKTVVIEHGAGLKSVFYNLNKINVQEGDPIVQGQILGETNKVTVGEVRIGRVPVEPLSIWRGQCDAVKNF